MAQHPVLRACFQLTQWGSTPAGSDTPDYLEDLPGSYGFDPLGLGSVPGNLERFRESELIHCRWAMAGAAGVLAVELAGQGNWFDAPLWVRRLWLEGSAATLLVAVMLRCCLHLQAVKGGSPTYLGVPLPFDINTLVAVVRVHADGLLLAFAVWHMWLISQYCTAGVCRHRRL